MKGVKITETIFRDAHQSLIATRMKTDEMLPIANKLDQVGYHSLEVWGGATFDACLRYLNEDPWERLRKLRKVIKDTKLQMLIRGQNLLGYKHYPDDVVEYFIQKSIENGIDIVRTFDALNDVRNLRTGIEATKRAKGHAQAAIAYTVSPVHNIDYYLTLAKDMVKIGADSICIKDMSGILLPYTAVELIRRIKKEVNVPIQLHSHFTSGVANLTYLKAIESGVDIIDTAISPFGMGTSQPATESIVAALKDSEFDSMLDLSLLNEIAEYFSTIKKKYLDVGLLNIKVLDVNIKTLIYQVPGGMLSNLMAQLELQGSLDKFQQVLEEIPRVRKELGYPPLVTPMSQMVGTQAVFNIILNKRYKIVPTEIKNYIRGLYGKPTIPICKEIRQKIIGSTEVYRGRPADLLKPQLRSIKSDIKEYLEQDEDILTYALFPQLAMKFFQLRRAKKYKIDGSLLDLNDKTYPV